MRYRVTAGTLTVQARSRMHDTTTVWNRITGEIDADPETLASAGATARFEVDMTSFDAGDFLRNRKLRKDFELEKHAAARFTLRAVEDVVGDGATFTARAVGVLEWRGRKLELMLAGRGTLGDMAVDATATFDLDIRDLGLAAPRFLMFKMEDEVSVSVVIRGARLPAEAAP